MCCEVLNLQAQVGALHGSAALTEVYRVARQYLGPLKRVLAQNRECNITNTAGLLFYTTNWND